MLTSHYMDEVQHLADRAVVLSGGRIVAEGRPDTLGGRTPADTVISFRLAAATLTGRLPDEIARLITHRDGECVLRTSDPTRTLLSLCSWAVAHDAELSALHVTRRSLEDVYLQLTEDGNEDDG